MAGPYIDPEDELEEERLRREEAESAPPVTTGAPAAPPPDVPPVASAPVGGQPAMVGAPAPMVPLVPVAHPDAPPVTSHAMSPARQRLQSLIDQGAPPVQPLHGMKKFGDTLGKIFAPGIEDRIRNAPQHQYASDLGRAEADVTADKVLHPEAAPKVEQWSVVPGMVGPKGQVVQEEKNSGQIRYAPNVEGMHATKPQNETPQQEVMRDLLTGDNGSPRINPNTQKPYTTKEAFDEAQKQPAPNDKATDIKDYLEAHNLPDTAANREKARDEIAKRAPQAHVEVNPPKGDQGVLMEVPDGKGGHILKRILPGETIAPGSATPTQAGSVDIKNEQGEKAGKDALQYADDYMKLGAFTGPGDEALMEKFFELAKPSSGFRMTQAQIDMLKNAQGWMNSLEAKARHAITGTWFSDDQRAQIAGTMKMLADSRENKPQPQGGGGSKWNAKTGRYE